MDCSWPGSSIHGIFQTRILQWVTISFSRTALPSPTDNWVSPKASCPSNPFKKWLLSPTTPWKVFLGFHFHASLSFLKTWLGVPLVSQKPWHPAHCLSLSITLFFLIFTHLSELVLVTACGIFSFGMWDLDLWPGIEPGPPALGVWSLSYRTSREVPVLAISLFILVMFPVPQLFAHETPLHHNLNSWSEQVLNHRLPWS